MSDAPARRSPLTQPEPLVETAVLRGAERHLASAQSDVTRIMAAAYRVIGRTGTLDFTMRDLLAEAGLSTQGFYRYFPSKGHLVAALLEEGQRILVDYLRRRIAGGHTPAEKVAAWIEGVMAQVIDAEARTRTRPFLVDPKYPQLLTSSKDALVALLEDAITSPSRPRRPAGGRADAEFVFHTALSVMTEYAFLDEAPPREFVDELVSFCLRAIEGNR
ncbi:TetR/AcrR family transcriptional regulator [Mycolicibacterium sp. XJ1819]